MKKTYFAPEVLVHKLEVKDIMTQSPEVSLNQEVGDGKSLSINDDVEPEESDDDDW